MKCSLSLIFYFEIYRGANIVDPFILHNFDVEIVISVLSVVSPNGSGRKKADLKVKLI